jgi:hypothetical protein
MNSRNKFSFRDLTTHDIWYLVKVGIIAEIVITLFFTFGFVVSYGLIGGSDFALRTTLGDDVAKGAGGAFSVIVRLGGVLFIIYALPDIFEWLKDTARMLEWATRGTSFLKRLVCVALIASLTYLWVNSGAARPYLFWWVFMPGLAIFGEYYRMCKAKTTDGVARTSEPDDDDEDVDSEYREESCSKRATLKM